MTQFTAMSYSSRRREERNKKNPERQKQEERKRRMRAYVNALAVCSNCYLPYEWIYYISYMGTWAFPEELAKKSSDTADFDLAAFRFTVEMKKYLQRTMRALLIRKPRPENSKKALGVEVDSSDL